MNDKSNLWFALGGLILFLIVAAACVSEADERKHWEQFKQDHHCKITQKIDGETNLIVTGKDVGVSSSSPKTGWTCDDGITYFKAD